ncbi:MAG: DUF222 domain-containing protein [Actinomycetota bacterium]
MEIARLAQRVGGLDVDSSTAGSLTAALSDLRALRGRLSSIEGRITRRLGELAEVGAALPVTDTIGRTSKGSRREAEKTRRRGEALGDAPTLEGHLEKGRVSDEHVDALAAAMGRVDDSTRAEMLARENELSDRACSTTPSQFSPHLGRVIDELTADGGLERSERQRQRAQLSHGVNDETGMGWIRADLHPDDYQRVKRRLDSLTTTLSRRPEKSDRRREQVAVDAFVQLVTRPGGAGSSAGSTAPPDVQVLTDLDTLVHGLHEHSIAEYSDGTPIPVETVRRLACEANLIPVVLDSAGMPLDVGRGRRLATPAQRAALRSMYRTCAVGGCDTDVDRCEIHHVDEWEDMHGPTDLDNLVPLCSYHHHRCHEGRWRLQLDASSRQLTVFLPDGTEHSRALPDLLQQRRDDAA